MCKEDLNEYRLRTAPKESHSIASVVSLMFCSERASQGNHENLNTGEFLTNLTANAW
jgi:hypothetical protein